MTMPLVEKFSCKDDLSAITDPTKLVGNDFFTKSLDFNQAVKTLHDHLKRCVTSSAFTILIVQERMNNFTGTHQLALHDNSTVSLLKDYASIDLHIVMMLMKYYVTHSNNNAINVENLAWSQDLPMM
jgi:hypothetical protein